MSDDAGGSNMTIRSIIFSGPMVRALLEGRKTQTRQANGLQDVNEKPDAWSLHNVGPLGYMAKPSSKGKFGATFESREIEAGTLFVCPQALLYAVGDRLWVRETCRAVEHEDGEDAIEYLADGACVRIQNTIQAADRWGEMYHYGKRGPDRAHREGQNVPSIHMPRWASRLTLVVTDVRVQRVQEISEADAVAEGFFPTPPHPMHGPTGRSARDNFKDFWSNIYHGNKPYQSNPWVVAYTFTVHRCNVDQMPAE